MDLGFWICFFGAIVALVNNVTLVLQLRRLEKARDSLHAANVQLEQRVDRLLTDRLRASADRMADANRALRESMGWYIVPENECLARSGGANEPEELWDWEDDPVLTQARELAEQHGIEWHEDESAEDLRWLVDVVRRA